MTNAIAQADLIKALRRILPAHSVLADAEQTRPYECDSLTTYRQLPRLVVLPENEEQILAVLAICKQYQIPIVARGAGTGLSGGAMPVADGIVLSTAKLKKIVRIDPLERIAVVQPGVRNVSVSEAASRAGLFYAPDPSSQLACTIGGNVAENAGGVHCLKYGLTVHNVLAARVLTIDGEILELGGEALDTPGLDLLSLMIGSEGMLGIVTEVTLRLLPKPSMAQVILASFDSVEAAGQAVANIIAAGLIPAALEMMDQTSVRMVEPFVKAGYDLEAKAILLCEADGSAVQVREEIALMSRVLNDSGARQLRVSYSEEERMKYWSGRKNAFPAAGRISPDYYCVDGTIPRQHLARVLLAITDMEKKYGLLCANVFHAGDGNLHPLILFDANQAGAFKKAEAFGAEILELCVELGGSITGEHGVGVEKLNSMCVQFTPEEMQTLHDLKSAFDGNQLLNPGKGIPSLNRCAEYGRMHVAGGIMKFPHLERF